MKYKMKLFIFIVETAMLLCIISMMIFTRICNGSYFSIFHQFDKQKHLILKEKINLFYQKGMQHQHIMLFYLNVDLFQKMIYIL